MFQFHSNDEIRSGKSSLAMDVKKPWFYSIPMMNSTPMMKFDLVRVLWRWTLRNHVSSTPMMKWSGKSSSFYLVCAYKKPWFYSIPMMRSGKSSSFYLVCALMKWRKLKIYGCDTRWNSCHWSPSVYRSIGLQGTQLGMYGGFVILCFVKTKIFINAMKMKPVKPMLSLDVNRSKKNNFGFLILFVFWPWHWSPSVHLHVSISINHIPSVAKVGHFFVCLVS